MDDLTTEPAARESAGALLRAARERQGLHIAALAAAIKVAPRKLDALENDRWHELPDATFVRALAQTVCRTLKIDAKPVLALLPAAASAMLESVGGVINEPFRDRPGRELPGLAMAAVRPMVWAAGALALAALTVYFVPSGWWTAPPVSLPATLPNATPAPALQAAAVPASATAPAASAAEPLPPPPAGETVFAAPGPTLAATAPPDAVPAAPAGVLQLRSTESSWVEVRDARGQSLLSRTVQPGESVGLDGALPIRLTIGNAAATQLVFRGKSVELAGYTRDNVARVELR